MKKIMVSIVVSMVFLTGCLGRGQDAIIQGLNNSVDQEYLEITSDLQVKFQKARVDFYELGEEDSSLMPASYEDEYGKVNFSTDELLSSGGRIVNGITIQSQLDLSQHPLVQVLAQVMEEEKVLAWVANQEKKIIQSDQEEIVQELLVRERTYLFFEYIPGSKIRTLEFVWAPKPSIPEDFKEIAQQLEGYGLLTTGYIEGVGGQTLIVTNPDYYFLEKRRYQRNQEKAFHNPQAATYKVMLDQGGNYGVQLYGYMDEDLSYSPKIENMPGLDDITNLIKMDEEDFTAITEKINIELSKARELLNDNFQREYYLEGNIGEYHYTVMVPEGIGIYNFTVLIEKI